MGQDKSELRAAAAARRAALDPARRAAARRANADHLRTVLAGPVCAFLPLPSEPLDPALLDDLVRAGTSVLVPVTAPDAPLDWCRHPGPLAAGPFGIATPTGPRLGPAAARTARTVLLPAFAVDGSGHRLGRGGGHYDRTLAALAPAAPLLVAVLFDGELADTLPTLPHDRPVDAVVTPSGGLRLLR